MGVALVVVGGRGISRTVVESRLYCHFVVGGGDLR